MSISAKWVCSALVLFCIALSGCAIKAPELVEMPPADTGVFVKSINVKIFSSKSRDYGERLAAAIISSLAKQGYIQVTDRGAEAILTGQIDMGRIQESLHSESYQTKVKEDGRKYTKTKYIYYYKKQSTSSVTYFLKKGSVLIASNTYSAPFEKTWSGGSSEQAKADAWSNDQIIQHQLSDLAQEIVAGISPHKEQWDFEIQGSSIFSGSHPGLKAGAEYYSQKLYSQAEAYWDQVLQQSTEVKDQAAAHYNLGVLKIHDKQFQQAFEHFREADRLAPANRVYMEALRKVEAAEVGRRNLQKGLKPVGAQPLKQSKRQRPRSG